MTSRPAKAAAGHTNQKTTTNRRISSASIEHPSFAHKIINRENAVELAVIIAAEHEIVKFHGISVCGCGKWPDAGVGVTT